MKLVTEEIERWKRWSKGMAEMSDETTLNVSEDEVSTLCDYGGAMAMLRILFKEESFEEYDVDKERALAINIEKFSKILNNADKDDEKMVLELGSANSTLEITFKNSGVRTFTLPLLSRNLQSSELPSKMKHCSSFTIKAGKFLDELDSVSLMSDRFTLETNDDGLFFSSTEEGEGNYNSNLTEDDLESLNVGEACTSTFKIDIVESMIKSLKNSWKIDVSIGKGQPIAIESGDDNSKLNALVAPIIKRE